MHQGSCECDAGEFHGDKIHEWLCPWLMCLLGECSCDAVFRAPGI